MPNDTDVLKGQVAALRAAVDALIQTHHSAPSLRSKFSEAILENQKILQQTGASPETLKSLETTSLKIVVSMVDKVERQGTSSLGQFRPDGSFQKS